MEMATGSIQLLRNYNFYQTWQVQQTWQHGNMAPTMLHLTLGSENNYFDLFGVWYEFL